MKPSGGVTCLGATATSYWAILWMSTSKVSPNTVIQITLEYSYKGKTSYIEAINGTTSGDI